MGNLNTPQNQPSSDESDLTFDEIDHLFIGHFEAAAGEVATELEVYPAWFSGEFLIYGHQDENGFFKIDRVRRIALVGQLWKPEEEPRIGFISLAGPLAATKGSPDVIQDIQLQLHYNALSTSLEPLIFSPHAEFPQMEVILTDFSWKQASQFEQTGIDLDVGLTAEELYVSHLGIVNRVTLNDQKIHFEAASGKGVQPLAAPIPLGVGCLTPAGPNRPVYETRQRKIRIKFVNFSTTVANIQNVCDQQIAGMCAVWSQKGVLYVTEALLEQGTQAGFNVLTAPEETTIHAQGYATSDHLEVYLVNNTATNHGGAVAKNAGTGDAYIILEAAQAAANPRLLAHEIGHALNLAHPDGSQGILPSTLGSVMEERSPNFVENTLYNCRIFKCSNPPLPGLVTFITPNVIDYYRPDNDFFIRDFPADTGTEPSSPPAGETFWSNSNIWNRRNNNPGGVNATGGPQHEEPLCMDNQDFAHVRLEYTNNLRDPVDVDVYITEPGVSAATLLTPLNPAGNRLAFTLPAPNPYVKSLSWSPSNMAAMFPPHSCLYAIADLHYDCTLITPIPAPTFGYVSANILSNNKIAQRNINFQCAPAPGPSPLWSWSPWVQMANPFIQPGPAFLDIDSERAAQLEGLVLEVDGETNYTFQAGEHAQIMLDENLGGEEYKIIRIAVALPADAELGSRYEIDLAFSIGDQLVAGYQHVMEIASLSTAVIQTIDSLFGALKAVAIGCNLELAETLAYRIQRIYYYNRKYPERALRSLARLSKQLSKLAQFIDPFAERECRQVHDHLLQLAGELQWGIFTSPQTRVEALRVQVDRIYEPASRMARRKLEKPQETESDMLVAG